jgi:hypothetical protein
MSDVTYAESEDRAMLESEHEREWLESDTIVRLEKWR